MKAFLEGLFDRQVSRSAHNNYEFAITEYHKMLGETMDIPFLPRNVTLPYFFSEEDLDLNNQTLRMREGKSGREGYDFITDDCAPCTIF